MIRKQLLTTLGLVALVVLFAIGFASAADYYVEAGGTGDGSAWGNSFGTIQQAIDACVSGSDTIHVAKGIYNTSTGESFPITISNKTGITMFGYDHPHNGPWIQGCGDETNMVRVIDIDHSSGIWLQNFKVSDGYADGDGGGIYVHGTLNDECLDIVLFDLEVTDNRCNSDGGGIATYRSCGRIENCCVWGNEASGSSAGGGGIFISWPAYSESTEQEGFYVRDCCIFWNSASCYGGGILMSGNGYHNEIVNNLVRQNCVGQVGEGAGIQSRCAKVYIKNNTVADNYHCEDRMPTHGDPAPQYNVYGISACDVQDYWMNLIHNIVYFNGPASFDDVNSNENLTVMYCDVQMHESSAVYPGTGNINEDPMFEGEEQNRPCNSMFYFLSKDSLCVDAGIPADEDEWGQTHCSLVNTDCGYKDYRYSVHEDGSQDEDYYCASDRNNGCAGDDNTRIDLGYHYDWNGMNYVELASFDVEVQSDSVTVNWETATEIDNAGFIVYRCSGQAEDCARISGFIPANGLATSGAEYSFTDRNVSSGAGYYYYLVDIDTHGKWTAHGPVFARIPLALIDRIDHSQPVSLSKAQGDILR